MIRQIKVKERVVVDVLTASVLLEGYTQEENLKVIKGSIEKKENDFILPPVIFILNLEKQKLIKRVHDKATWAFQVLDQKFKFTHSRGVADKIAGEFLLLEKGDEGVPYIMQFYAKLKGKTLNEQKASTARIINFELTAIAKIEQLVGMIQDATEDTIGTVSKEIDAICEVETIEEFMIYVSSE